MSLRVAIQMDPPEALALGGDTTFAMALEAVKRGHTLFYYAPQGLYLDEHWLPGAKLRPLKAECAPERFYAEEHETAESLTAFDVVLIRQDPPYNMTYLTTTWLLERLKTAPNKQPVLVNDPKILRDAPEKLWLGGLCHYVPRSLISDDLAQVRAFAETCADGVVLKPLYGNGGRGVLRSHSQDENLASLLESWRDAWDAPPQVQEFLPAVAQGDKRVLLIAGKVAGALNRVPQAGEFRANLRNGATAEVCGLTDKEQDIAEQVATLLWQEGVFVAGLDFIDGWLTEVNITSPTGFRGLEEAPETKETGETNAVACSALFWDAIEQAVAKNKGA